MEIEIPGLGSLANGGDTPAKMKWLARTPSIIRDPGQRNYPASPAKKVNWGDQKINSNGQTNREPSP